MPLINGNDANNNCTGTEGNDTLFGYGGSDTLGGDVGNDWLNGGASIDFLYGGVGNDTLVYGTNDYFDGGDGNDVLYVGGMTAGIVLDLRDAVRVFSCEQIVGTLYADTLASNEQSVQMVAGGGDDIVLARTGADTLVGGSGNDLLSGSGNDMIDAGSGNDIILYHLNDNIVNVSGGDGIDLLDFSRQREGIRLDLQQATDVEYVSGGAGNDTFIGSAADNLLIGGRGDDSLLGGSGNDTLYGGYGDDTLSGGTGNDFLTGSRGNDVYVVESGSDVILQSANTSSDNDLVIFGSGWAPNTITLSSKNDDLVLTLSSASTDSLTIKGWYAQSNDNLRLNRFTFVDGSTYYMQDNTWKIVETLQTYSISDASVSEGGALEFTVTRSGNTTNASTVDFATTNGTAVVGNDYMAQNGTLSFAAGETSKIISAATVDDSIIEDNEFLTVNLSNASHSGTLVDSSAIGTITDNDYSDSVMIGSSNNDTILGYGGNDVLYGNDGADYLSSGAGNDTLDGGAGSDTLIGGVGNDFIYYDYADLIGNISGGTGRDTLSAVGASGTVTIDLSRYIDIENLAGSAVSDKLTGDEGANIISGGAGDDTIDGGLGADIIDGGVGNDVVIYDYYDLLGYVTGGDGYDILDASAFSGHIDINLQNDYPDFEEVRGGQGSNNITGNARSNLIMGGAGNTSTGIASSDGGVATRDIVRRLIGGMKVDSQIYGLADSSYIQGSAEWIDCIGRKLEVYPLIGFGGQDGNDNLYGLDGNDTIFGYGGNDMLGGGADNDVLVGGDGQNYLDGGDGDDLIQNQMSGKHNTLIGGAGKDTIAGYINDTLLGGTGDDQLTIYINSLADGGEGNDSIVGSWNSTLKGGQGNDTLVSSYSRSMVIDNYVGAGVDNGNDVLVINASMTGSEPIYSRDGNDLVLSSVFTTGESVRVLNWFLGQEYHIAKLVINGIGSSQTILADEITRLADSVSNLPTEGRDVLIGTAPDSFGFYGDDVLNGLEGNDTIFGGEGDDTLFGGGDNDVLVGGDGRNYLDGGYGDDLIQNQISGNHNTLIGGAGNDTIAGYTNDTLLGGTGDDQLTIYINSLADGGEGNDSIVGSWNSTLKGGQGNDTLVSSYSRNMVIDNFVGAGVDNGNDVLVIDASMTGSEPIYSREGNDLVLSSVFTTGESVRVLNWFLGQAYEIEKVIVNRVSGITIKSADEITSMVNGSSADPEAGKLLSGTAGSDSLVGSIGNDTIFGYAADDTLFGGGGNDVLVGGDGRNYIDGGYGDDLIQNQISGNHNTLIGGAGNDTIAGYTNDTLLGGTGDDYLTIYINSLADGGEGNDSIVGSWNSTLKGGQGNDTLVSSYSRNMVIDNFVGAGVDNGNDVLVIDASMTGSEPIYSRDGNDLVLSSVFTTGESVRVLNWFLGENYQIKKLIINGNGATTIYMADQLSGFVHQNAGDVATEGNDVLVGLGGADSFNGFGGNDTIYGLDGDDALFGGGDDDILAGGNGKDYLDGGDGNDRLIEWGILDTLLGGAGDDTLEGWYYDTLSGGIGNDIISSRGYCLIDGSDGNDTLRVSAYDTVSGGLGSDIYSVRANTLRKLLIQTMDNVSGTDMLRFESGGKNESDFSYSKDGNDLVFDYVESGVEAVRIANWFLAGDFASIQFADGAVFTGSQIADLALGNGIDGASQGNDAINGSISSDTLYGFIGNDSLYGDSSIDALYGGGGVDLLDGGMGIDSIYGGTGDDQIIYDVADATFDGGSGQDLLDASAVLGTITIDLAQDEKFISIENILGGQGNNSLIGNQSDNILTGQNADDTLSGSAGHDSLQGNGGLDLLSGGDGEDMLGGGAGNDTLDGGNGNDLLDGGQGNDVFSFENSWGQDTIHGGTGSLGDQLWFKNQTAADLTLIKNGNDIVFTSKYGDTVRLENWCISVERCQTAIFADGTTDTFSNLLAIDEAGNNQTGGAAIVINQSEQGNINSGGDQDWYRFTAELSGIYQVASAIDNGLHAYLYDDTGSLVAQDNAVDGDNRLSFAANLVSGNEYYIQLTYDDFTRSGSYDLVITTPPNPIIDSNDSNNVSGTAGVDIILGELGADTLYGSGGSDRLSGSIGEDDLFGGAGDDTLYGGNTTPVNQGNKYAVMVGISDYLSPEISDLPYPLNDIGDMEGFLDDNPEWLGTQVTKLTDAEATEAGILVAIHDLATKVVPGDQAIFYYSGHGMEQTGELCPYDIGLTSDGIDQNELKNALQEVVGNIGNGHVTVVLDSCFSGQFVDAFAGSGSVFTVYSGAGNDEYGWEIGALENGLFSYYFVDRGLIGQLADHNGDGQATTSEAYEVAYQKIQRFIADSGMLGTHSQMYDGSNGSYVLASYDRDYMEGGAGNDLVYGYYSKDTLKGGIGDDSLDGGEHGDLLYGEEGNDWLFGGNGNDILDGGKGNDVLNGGTGNDVYLFTTDFSADKIVGAPFNSNDCVEFGAQFTIENLLVSIDGINLGINDMNGNRLTIEDWGLGGGYGLNRFLIQGVWYNTNGYDWQLAPDDNNGRLPPY